MSKYHGRVPSDPESLLMLPGIGPYTAAAVSAFAFDRPVVMIETNIRTVLFHHFFSKRKKVNDRELLPILAASLDRNNPRRWFSALMDYGAALKKRLPNPGRRSAHPTPQSKFAGSNRQMRGMVVRLLLKRPMTANQLVNRTKVAPITLAKAVRQLEYEQLVMRQGRRYRIV